jgi:disulfide bond formation protein DsbB
MILISAVIGAGIAGRQVWLQHLPPDAVPACGPGLEFMLDVFPLAEALKMVFTGSGECAEVNWTFIGFSIAEWSLVCFTVIAISSILHLLNKLPNFIKT